MIQRQWGHYEVLHESPGYKVKKLVLSTEKGISYQLHHHRTEHWVNVQGAGRVTLDDQLFNLYENSGILIPKLAKHKLENIGKIPLVIIETQYGPYLEEDDIVRFDNSQAIFNSFEAEARN